MKLFISLFLCAWIFGVAERPASAQTSGATAYAERQQQEARWRKLSSQMEEMLASQETLRSRVQMLEKENRRLTKRLNESGNTSVTPLQLDKLAKDLNNKIQLVDKNRQADQKSVTKEVNDSFNRLEKLIKNQKGSGGRSGSSASPPSFSGEFYEHTIESGQTISAVVQAFRKQGIKVSTDSILKANPGLVPEKMQVGQVIKIPKP